MWIKCGVHWTKFECISGKIRRILTNNTCASAARALLARGKIQKFPIIFYCGSPHTPRREAEHLKGRKFLGLLPPLHSSKKAYRSFSPILRPPYLRHLRRPEALLKVLKSSNLVEDERQGQEVLYSVNVSYMAGLLKKLATDLPDKK